MIMVKPTPTEGFSHILLIVLIAAVLSIGFIGYRVFKSDQDKITTVTTELSTDDQISTKEDLSKAADSLKSSSLTDTKADEDQLSELKD